MHNHTRHIEASCAHCDRTYQQEQATQCVWQESGRPLGGFDGEHWYGDDDDGIQRVIQDPETDDRVFLDWVNVYPMGGPYDVCDTCQERHHAGRHDSYDSDLEPSWFDPADAGERWDD